MSEAEFVIVCERFLHKLAHTCGRPIAGVWYLTTFSNYSGLECLCSILKCMVEWSREYYIDPSTTGLNAVYRSVTGMSTAEGEINNVDGVAAMEVQEPQPGLTTAGRQMRGSFSTLRPEPGTPVR